MLLRMWRGWTTPERADTYEHLLTGGIVPGILERASSDELHELAVLRRSHGSDIEFVTLMRFEGWPAVERFAGPDTTNAVVPDTARQVLSRFDLQSAHYDLVFTGRPGEGRDAGTR